MLSTVCNTQRGSLSPIEKRRGRNEREVAGRIKGGIRKRETDPASNQFPKCSTHCGTPREIHRVTQRKEEERGR